MNKSSALAGASMLLLLLQVLLVSCSPIRYDQRQDGDANVDARLKNFFVVLAPSNTAQLGSTGVSLLDLASKAVPLRLRPQGLAGVGAAADGLKQREDVDQEQQGQEVKEAKSGRSVSMPLAAVAIPAAILQSPLAKLHPEVQALTVEEVLIARSPVVALRSPPGPAPIGAPSAAVPMLVAVPVPEVAPERPATLPALLPMHPAGPAPLGDKPVPAAEAAPAAIAPVADIAASETIASVADAMAAAPAIASADVAAPVIAEVEAAAASDAAPAPAALIEAAPPAVETNQVEPEPLLQDAHVQAPKVHLIGTGIEECGPERIRNQEGVCVDDPTPS